MLPRKYLIWASEASLLYNHIILMSVTLNSEWVRTRAAGGQYESFPPTLRVIYFVMAAFMITLAIWLWDHKEQKLNAGSKRLANILSVTFAISTIFQLISRSPDERWNAIPAFILAFTFFRLVRDSK
jgi:cytochrome bd-type quinol oxidase subunit 2